MTINQKLGIWMDHSEAYITDYSTDFLKTEKFIFEFTHQIREGDMRKSEVTMLHKEKDEQKRYYKKLGEIILKYSDVILFGPTSAKQELHNLLKTNHLFDKIKITVLPADKMTEIEQQLFVKNFFQ
jgi:hypothetical protein